VIQRTACVWEEWPTSRLITRKRNRNSSAPIANSRLRACRGAQPWRPLRWAFSTLMGSRTRWWAVAGSLVP